MVGGLVSRGWALLRLQLPPWDWCFIAITAGVRMDSFHSLCHFYPFLLYREFLFQQRENSSTSRGKMHAPAVGSEVPSPPGCTSAPGRSSHLATISAPTGTQPPSHRVNPLPANALRPSLCAVGGDRLQLPGTRVRPGAMSPPWCRAVSPHGHPCVLLLMGARWVLSIPPSQLACRLLYGQRGSRTDPPHGSRASMLYLQLSVGKQGVLCLFFGRLDGQGKFMCLLGPRAVPPPRRLLSLFSVWRQGGKTSPHGTARAVLPSTGAVGAAAAHQPPPRCLPPPAHYPHSKTFRADAASYSVLT